MSNIEKLNDPEFVKMMERAGILTSFVEAMVKEYLAETDERYWQEVYRLYGKAKLAE